MAGTVWTDLKFFTGGGYTSCCDSAGGWSGGTMDAETYVQGSGSLSAKVSSTTATYTFTVTPAVDLTDKAIYAWFNCATPNKLDTMAGGGLRIRVVSGSNYYEWYVAGSDNYFGGWECFVAHTSYTANASSSTPPNLAGITGVGVVFETLSSVAKTNCWWDAIRYGTGVTIYGGTGSAPTTFDDILTMDDSGSNKWGVMIPYAGIKLLQGKITIGDTGSNATYFKDTNAPVMICRDRLVPSTFYDISLKGNGSAWTEVYWGDELGGAGVAGPILRCQNTASHKYTVDATDTNVTKFGILGTSLYNAGKVSGQAYNVDKKFLDTLFYNCVTMEPSTGIVESCTFISSTGSAILMVDSTHNITYTDFINCSGGVYIDDSDTYSFNNLNFYNCTHDIIHNHSGSMTINCTDSNASTVRELAGGSTTINNTKTLTLTDIISGSVVTIVRLSDSVVLSSGSVGITETYEYPYTYTGDVSVDILVLHLSYEPLAFQYILGDANVSLPISQVSDYTYYNPA